MINCFDAYCAIYPQHKRGNVVFKHWKFRSFVYLCVILFVLGSLSACKKEEAAIVFDVEGLTERCNTLTLQAVEGDVSPIYEMIKEDYRNGTSLEGFQEYLETRLSQAEEFEDIIKSDFSQGEHPLEKYKIGSIVNLVRFTNGLMTFTYQFNEENEMIGFAVTFEVRKF